MKVNGTIDAIMETDLNLTFSFDLSRPEDITELQTHGYDPEDHKSTIQSALYHWGRSQDGSRFSECGGSSWRTSVNHFEEVD